MLLTWPCDCQVAVLKSYEEARYWVPTAEEQLNREMSREYGAEELGVYYATKRAVWVVLTCLALGNSYLYCE